MGWYGFIHQTIIAMLSHFHKFSFPEQEAMRRVWRLGQEKEVNVTFLSYGNTVEEEILRRKMHNWKSNFRYACRNKGFIEIFSLSLLLEKSVSGL